MAKIKGWAQQVKHLHRPYMLYWKSVMHFSWRGFSSSFHKITSLIGKSKLRLETKPLNFLSSSNQLSSMRKVQFDWKKMDSLVSFAEECFNQDKYGNKPLRENVNQLRHWMESFTLFDLGYTKSTLSDAINQSNAPEDSIHFMDFYETPSLSIKAFILKQGQKLPLHDHVGMVVISKIITGRCKICIVDVKNYEKTTPSDLNTRNGTVSEYNDPFKEYSIGDTIEGEVLFDGELPSRLSVPDIPSLGQYSYIEETHSNPIEDIDVSNASTTLSNTREGSCDSFGLSSEPGTTNDNDLSILPSDEFPSTLLVLPNYGNIHHIEATESITVFFDILSPSYFYENRFCNFYKIESPSTYPNKKGRIMLQVVKPTNESFTEIPLM